MKTLLHLILSLAASIGLANAEITDDTMRGLQASATERIEIEVLKASKSWRPGGSFHKVHAKVTAVSASASGLKVGDKIAIHYHVSKAPGSYPRTVEKGKLYKAYLRLDPDKKDKTYGSSAGRGTFVAK